MANQTIELGDRVEDFITEFKGIATIKERRLDGRVRFLVEAKYKEFKFREAWFDASRLSILMKGSSNVPPPEVG